MFKGFQDSLVGATMPDLRTRFGTEASGISYALSVGKIGAMIGSLMSAFMDRLVIAIYPIFILKIVYQPITYMRGCKTIMQYMILYYFDISISCKITDILSK